jgi:hypothetical protein
MPVSRASLLSAAAVGAIALAVLAPVMTAPISNAYGGGASQTTMSPSVPCDGHPWDDCP